MAAFHKNLNHSDASFSGWKYEIIYYQLVSYFSHPLYVVVLFLDSVYLLDSVEKLSSRKPLSRKCGFWFRFHFQINVWICAKQMLTIRSRWRARLSSRCCLEKWAMAAARMWAMLQWLIRWATSAARMCCPKDGRNVEPGLVACTTWTTIRKPPNGSVLIIGKCSWTRFSLFTRYLVVEFSRKITTNTT